MVHWARADEKGSRPSSLVPSSLVDDSYIHGTRTTPLRDGPPHGTNYIVSAAHLAPLTPGKHTVEVGGIIDGEPVVLVSNTVTVANH